jgi:hypothetical protein
MEHDLDSAVRRLERLIPRLYGGSRDFIRDLAARSTGGDRLQRSLRRVIGEREGLWRWMG